MGTKSLSDTRGWRRHTAAPSARLLIKAETERSRADQVAQGSAQEWKAAAWRLGLPAASNLCPAN